MSPPRTSPKVSRILCSCALVALSAAALLPAIRKTDLNSWFGGMTRPASPPTPPIEPVLAARTVTVVPGVHMLGTLFPSAVYVIETSQGLVLVDSGFEAEYDELIRGIAGLGLDPSRVTALLLTHAHGDHAMGALALRRQTGAKIYAGRDDAQVLRDGGPWEAIFSKYETPAGVTAHATPVDVELSGGEVLWFGDTRVEVLATPGHTPGSVCYLLDRDGRRIFFSGDTLMTLSAGLGTHAAALPPRHRGDARAYLNSLRKLSSLSAPDLLLPGHPRLDPLPRRPRISPSQWQSLLGRGIRELEELIEHHGADGADFLDGQAKEILPGLHFLGSLEGYAVYLLATPTALLLVNAPGGDALPDWLDSKRRALGLEARTLTALLLTSCEPEAISGLPALLTRSRCRVVAAPTGLSIVKPLCPADTEFLDPEALERSGWIDVKALALADVYPAATGYIVRWEGTKVLISGRMPIQRSPSECRALQEALDGPLEGGAEAYRQSLVELRRVRPRVWLSAVPLHGRNANLYGREWEELLAFSTHFLSFVKPAQRPPGRPTNR
ncbi:MAG TPA: MBL fold metallo-hydrolase [Pirellulales bacterium]|nr:MBL fold metallo-hydrolase [Pirellulales bacterium]